MRILWLFILILVLAAVGLLTFQGSESDPDRLASSAPQTESMLDESLGQAPSVEPPPSIETAPDTVANAPTSNEAASAPSVEGSMRELANQLAISATTRLNATTQPDIVPTEDEVRDKPIVKAGLDVQISTAEVNEGSIRQLSERTLWVDGEDTNGSGTVPTCTNRPGSISSAARTPTNRDSGRTRSPSASRCLTENGFGSPGTSCSPSWSDTRRRCW